MTPAPVPAPTSAELAVVHARLVAEVMAVLSTVDAITDRTNVLASIERAYDGTTDTTLGLLGELSAVVIHTGNVRRMLGELEMAAYTCGRRAGELGAGASRRGAHSRVVAP